MENDIKIAVINDSSIDYMLVGNQDHFHSFLLEQYIKKQYSAELGDINIDFDNANSMSMFLREQGNIVFLNDTTYTNGKPGKHGKTGIFIFPDTINDAQIDLLLQLNERIQDYDELQIWYDFSSHFECKNIFTKNKEQVKTIIPYVIEKLKKSKTR